MNYIERLQKSAARNVKIVTSHRGGESMASIGRRLGISRERVRQIIARSRRGKNVADTN